MSVLADMLKKADSGQAGGDIPPGLVEAARNRPATQKSRTRLLLAVALVVAISAGGGLAAIYWVTRPVPRTAPPALPVTPAAIVQKQISTLPAPPAAPQVVAKPLAAAPLKSAVPSAKPPKAVAHRKQVVADSAAAPRSAPDAAVPAQPEEPPKKVVVRDRATIDALLFAARSAESRRDYPAALRNYQKALEADPDNYRIMNNLSGIYLQLGLNQDAYAVASRALLAKPEYVAALVNGGIAQIRMGNENAAKELFRRAVARDATNRAALQNLGLLLERSGAWDDAIAVFKRLADTGDAQGYLGMARVLERRGSKAEALRAYRDVVALPEAGQRVRETARERISVLEQ